MVSSLKKKDPEDTGDYSEAQRASGFWGPKFREPTKSFALGSPNTLLKKKKGKKATSPSTPSGTTEFDGEKDFEVVHCELREDSTTDDGSAYSSDEDSDASNSVKSFPSEDEDDLQTLDGHADTENEAEFLRVAHDEKEDDEEDEDEQ